MFRVVQAMREAEIEANAYTIIIDAYREETAQTFRPCEANAINNIHRFATSLRAADFLESNPPNKKEKKNKSVKDPNAPKHGSRCSTFFLNEKRPEYEKKMEGEPYKNIRDAIGWA